MPSLVSWWRHLANGFWFVPSAVALGYAALALVLVRVDRGAGADGADVGFGGDGDAARGILSTIAGSLITVAGLAFSLTILVLILVSSQFTPRALPRLLADRLNQVVAGSFVGLFAYCLLVLRTVRVETDTSPGFVPALAVSAAIVLALVALALLLLFIHHMGHSIQASQIVARMGRETLEAIDRVYSDGYRGTPAESGDDLVRAWCDQAEPQCVFPTRPGYVQAIALDGLLKPLEADDVRIHVPVRPGDFVTQATALVAVWPAEAVDEAKAQSLRRAISIENERSFSEDAGYGIRQLADVALKALSPGINDPTTAETCVGYLRAALECLAGRELPGEVHRHPDRQAVAVVRSVGFEEYAHAAYGEIGRFSSDNARVVSAVLEALVHVGESARAAGAQERTAIVVQLARTVAEAALERARTERDRALTREGLERVEAVVIDR